MNGLSQTGAAVDRKAQLDRYFAMFEQRLPRRVSRFVHWVRQPSSFYVRAPLGLALIVGGIFSFLPILGLWMLPLGLILIAQDIPFLQAPMVALLSLIERKWVERKWVRGGKASMPDRLTRQGRK